MVLSGERADATLAPDLVQHLMQGVSPAEGGASDADDSRSSADAEMKSLVLIEYVPGVAAAVVNDVTTWPRLAAASNAKVRLIFLTKAGPPI